MESIGDLAPNLRLISPGHWVTDTADAVSYPESGHSANFDVEDTSFWFRHRNDLISSLVDRFSPDETLFDIGGGNGCVSVALEKSGHRTVLVEPGEVGIANARTRGLTTVIHATLEDAGFLPGSLPAAGAFDVIEHIEDDVGFVRSLHGMLTPGAHFFVTVPAYQILWSAEDEFAGHYRRYSIGELRNLLEQAGFESVFSSYVFWPLPPVVMATRTIPSRIKLRKDPSSAAVTREHQAGGRPGSALMTMLLAPEAKRIAQAKSMPFGNSIIAVARRV